MKKFFMPLLMSAAFCFLTSVNAQTPDSNQPDSDPMQRGNSLALSQKPAVQRAETNEQLNPTQAQAKKEIEQTALAITKDLSNVFELSAVKWDNATISKYIANGMKVISSFDARTSKFFNFYMENIIFLILSKNPGLPEIKRMLIEKTHNPQIIDQLAKAVAAPHVQILAKKFDQQVDSHGNNLLDDINSTY